MHEERCMITYLCELIKKMKTGARYKKLLHQYFTKQTKSDDKLYPGAKIIYNAQSTFHTMK